MLPCKIADLFDFRCRNVSRIGSAKSLTFVMNRQHDAGRLFALHPEELLKNVDHKIHGRVVIVQN